MGYNEAMVLRGLTFGLMILPVLALGSACNHRALPGSDAPVLDARPAERGPGPDLPGIDRAVDRDGGLSHVEQVIRACVIAASCTKGDVWPAMSPSQCIDGYALLDWPHSGYGFGPDRKMARRLLDCTRGPGCSALFVCYGGNWIYNSVCREGGGCNGAQIVHYKDPGTYFDCATIGATCVGLPTGAIRSCCTKKACGGTAETVCTSATRGTHCMLGIPFDFDCGPTGRICTTLPKQTLCKGTGAPCNVQAKPTCAGSVASYCSAGQLAKVDCAANPFRSACSALSVVHPPCAGAGKACNASFKGACKGDAIVVCVNGSMRNVSCASLGFSGCSTLSQGARCVP